MRKFKINKVRFRFKFRKCYQTYRIKWHLFIKMATDWQASEVGDTCTPAAEPGRGRSVQIKWISAWTAHLGFPALLSVSHLLAREIILNRRHSTRKFLLWHSSLKLKQKPIHSGQENNLSKNRESGEWVVGWKNNVDPYSISPWEWITTTKKDESLRKSLFSRFAPEHVSPWCVRKRLPDVTFARNASRHLSNQPELKANTSTGKRSANLINTPWYLHTASTCLRETQFKSISLRCRLFREFLSVKASSTRLVEVVL